MRCLNGLPNTSDTRQPLKGGQAEVRHRQLSSGHVCIHVASWTDREDVSTVPHALNAPQADLSSQPPGDNWDYLDGDGMMLVSANHCLFMPNGLYSKTLEGYTKTLLDWAREKRINLPNWIGRFVLVPVADAEMIQKVYEQGVKKLQLNIGQYLETARERDDSRPKRIIENLGMDILMDLISKDEDRQKVEEAENVNARLIITLDSRRPGLKPEDLANIAQKAATESPDDVEFETRAGHRFKRGDLILKKSVEIEVFAKTIQHQDAWRKMSEYLNELSGSGVLEL